MKQQKKMLGVIIFIFLGGITFCIYSYYMTKVMGKPYPFGSFLFSPVDQYMDFFNVNRMVCERRPYVEFYSSYPPFALFLAWPFSLMLDYASHDYPVRDVPYLIPAKVSFILFFAIFSLLIAGMLFCFLKSSQKAFKHKILMILTIAALFCSAPYIYMIDRGNYLIVTIFLFLVFVYFYDKNETVAAIFLGISIALKIYPVFFFTLYFVEKKWKSMGIATCTAGGLSIASLLFWDGGVWQNIREFGAAVLAFGGGYPIESPNVYFGVGLTSLLRFPFVVWNELQVPKWFPVTAIYVIIGTALALWSLFLLRREQKFWKKILIVSGLMVFLTPTSYMYNLLYLFPALALFLVSDRSEKKWVDWVYLILLGGLMIPKAYWYILPEHLISIQVPIDCLLLLGLILFYNIGDKETRKMLEVKEKKV